MGGEIPEKTDERDVGPAELPDIETLVRDHHRVLYAYAYRLAGSAADAEDLTQQTYLIAQQKISQLRDGRKVRQWLFRVLRNGFIRSRQKKRPASASDLDVEIGQFAAAIDLDNLDSELLQNAIRELPDDYKIVVMMFYFDQLSYKEIAAELDSPIGTVMSRLARAKSALRNKLSGTKVG